MTAAILQVADQGPLESIVVMLRSVGYDCYLPNDALKKELRNIGLDTVLDIDNLVRGMGYERPFSIPEVGIADMGRSDIIYVDVKAHRAYDKLLKRWPSLDGKVLWYRIQGGSPEHVIQSNGFDCGDEVNPPCPVLTPNQWYKRAGEQIALRIAVDVGTVRADNIMDDGIGWETTSAYTCWPPFHRFHEYAQPRTDERYLHPLCLIHNVDGWGYQKLVEPMRELGVRCHGADSPDGLINHREIPTLLSRALCMVHLKSNDAPGYALYEALAAGCPVVCTRRLIWRCRMQELLIPGQTCLVFDRETHDGLTTEDVVECRREVQAAIKQLSDREENLRIGNAGRKRLSEVMWNADRDAASLRDFMERNFG